MPKSPARGRPGCVVFTTAPRLPLGAVLPLVAILVLVAHLIARPAMAQDAAADTRDPWAGVEEMVVTSSGVIDALTSATVSVTAFDSSDLEAMGAADMSDVAAFTPNLEIRTAGSTSATFFIRGVGLNAFDSNASGSVAIYEDDVPKNLPAIQLKQLFDVEAVSILKGPQGSGAGRNASAGAIKVYTRKPTGEFGGFLRFDYGNFNSIDVEGALEAPIVADVLAARAAFSLKRRDGLVTNRCAGLTQEEIDVGGACGNSLAVDLRPGLGSKLNDIDVWAGRFTAVYEPPDVDMQWTFSFHGSRRDQLGTVGEHIGARNTFGGSDRLNYVQPEIGQELQRILAPLPQPSNAECRRQFPGDPAAQAACRALGPQSRALASSLLAQNLADRPLDRRPFEGAYNNPGYERQTSWGAYVKGEWTLDEVKIDSITGFERDDRERLIDADYSPNTAFEFLIEDDLWQFTQDVQVSGELDEMPLSWNTGVFYLEERLDYYQFTFTRTPFEPSVADYVQDTRSFGVFADFEWNILTDLTLEAGGRYNWEYKRFAARIFAETAPGVLTSSCRISLEGEIPPCQRTLTVDHPTGTIKLNYDIDELRNVYVKYSHGWKGAQFNARDARKAGSVTDVADPEVIDAFEVGFKGSWFEDRLRLTSAFFWYTYDNYQVFTFSNNAGEPPQRIVINADDAELYGAEVETTLEPIDGLIAELRFSWLESRFLDFTDALGRQDGSVATRIQRIVTDFNNNPLPNAPRFKVSGNVSYPFPIANGMTITPRYEFTWSDDVYFDPSGGRGAPDATGEIFMPELAIGQEALILHNLRVTLTNESGTVEVSGWIRNLTNEVYKQLAFDASAGPGLVGNLVGDPRTYGLSAKVSF